MASSLRIALPQQLPPPSAHEVRKVAKNISDHFRGGLWLGHYQQYAKWKLRTDPLYEAVRRILHGTTLPVLDIGCGIGLLSFYLRESGMSAPVCGLDFDEAKVRTAQKVALKYAALEFHTSDVRQAWPAVQGNLCLLDVLQYLSAEEKLSLLRRSAQHVAPGGTLIIRSPLRENSWRSSFTQYTDRAANFITWMKSVPKHYPTRNELEASLAAEGLHLRECQPLWGRTPFNTHLLVFERAPAGSTQA